MSKVDAQGNDLSTSQVFLITRSLLGWGWCCAPKHMSAEEVQIAVDMQCEPYTPSCSGEPATPWTVCPRQHPDEAFISPGRCDEDCNRQHWFLLGGATATFLIALSPDQRFGLPRGLVIRMTFEDEYNYDPEAGFFTEADIAAEEAEDATIQ